MIDNKFYYSIILQNKSTYHAQMGVLATCINSIVDNFARVNNSRLWRYGPAHNPSGQIPQGCDGPAPAHQPVALAAHSRDKLAMLRSPDHLLRVGTEGEHLLGRRPRYSTADVGCDWISKKVFLTTGHALNASNWFGDPYKHTRKMTQVLSRTLLFVVTLYPTASQHHPRRRSAQKCRHSAPRTHCAQSWCDRSDSSSDLGSQGWTRRCCCPRSLLSAGPCRHWAGRSPASSPGLWRYIGRPAG